MRFFLRPIEQCAAYGACLLGKRCACAYIYGCRLYSRLADKPCGGYLALGEPQRALELREEITSQLALDKDSRLQGWMYLDYAKAYKMVGEIEKAIAELREFYLRCREMGSAHALSHITAMLVHLDEEGYGDVQAVKECKDELRVAH